MTVYRGFDVLELEPDWDADRPGNYSRRINRLDNGMAPVQVRDFGGRNFGSTRYRWWCGSRAEVKALRDFLDARRGQSVPFWFPTWVRDLTLSSPGASADQALVVKWRAYTDRVWPDTARRDLAIIQSSGAIYRRVTSSSQTATTETLTLSATLGAAVPVGALVCFMTLCRLASDSSEIVFQNAGGVATCELDFVEIPKEVP